MNTAELKELLELFKYDVLDDRSIAEIAQVIAARLAKKATPQPPMPS